MSNNPLSLPINNYYFLAAGTEFLKSVAVGSHVKYNSAVSLMNFTIM